MPAVQLDVGDVNRSHLIWVANLFVSQQTWNNCFLEIPFGQVRFGVKSVDCHLIHESANQLPANRKTLFPQFFYKLSAPQKRHGGMPVVYFLRDFSAIPTFLRMLPPFFGKARFDSCLSTRITAEPTADAQSL